MTLPAITRLLLDLGRLVGFAGAALSIALMAWWGYDVIRYAFFSENSTWGEVGVIPFVVVLRIIVAAWVVWSVIRLDGRTLLRVLLEWLPAVLSSSCTAGTSCSRAWPQATPSNLNHSQLHFGRLVSQPDIGARLFMLGDF